MRVELLYGCGGVSGQKLDCGERGVDRERSEGISVRDISGNKRGDANKKI